jgi:glycosyltransferase involved in cell wall biosynthesis
MSHPCLVLVITEDWYFWSHRLGLARAVRDAGWQVVVATTPGKLRQQIEAEGFRYYPLRLQRKGRNPWGEVLAILDLASLYRLARPDVVHHVAIKPVLYGSLAARLAAVPGVVNAVVGLGYVFISGGAKHTLLRTAVEWAYRLAFSDRRTRVIFQNPDDRNLFLQQRIVRAAQTVIIPGAGVDIMRFAPAPAPPGEPVVLLASRLLWDKGIGELVEAARILKRRNIAGRVVLAGLPDPSNPASIPQATLEAWQQEGVIEWIGRRSDMPAVLAEAHIACLPSYREGLPLSLIEAASCARPIVAANVPGCREIVQDGWNGLLVPVKDAQALADALQTLLTDAPLRQRMGQRGRELVLQRFAQEHIIEQTFAVYQSLR